MEDIFDTCCATLRVLEPLDRERNEVDLLNDDGTKIDLRQICLASILFKWLIALFRRNYLIICQLHGLHLARDELEYV